MAAPVYAEYSAGDNFVVQMLSVTDQNDRSITTLNEDTESVYIQALVKNPSWDGSVVMLAGIYDSETDKMKYLEQSGTVSIQKSYRGNLDIEISSSELTGAGAHAGDKIKLYIWDSVTGMQQMTDCIASDDFSGFTTHYSTNNVSDYNMHINEVRGDNWSYLCRYRDMTNTSALLNASMTMCRQNTGNTNGTWYTDPTGKTSNWYIAAGGQTRTETQRLMGFNYTIGSLTAGHRLKISGTFTGESNVILYVLKTDDQIESVSGYGKNAIGYSDDWLNNNVYKAYEDLPAGTGEFEFEIPADESVAGNDITFWVNRTGGSTAASNTLNVTISVMDDGEAVTAAELSADAPEAEIMLTDTEETVTEAAEIDAEELSEEAEEI